MPGDVLDRGEGPNDRLILASAVLCYSPLDGRDPVVDEDKKSTNRGRVALCPLRMETH